MATSLAPQDDAMGGTPRSVDVASQRRVAAGGDVRSHEVGESLVALRISLVLRRLLLFHYLDPFWYIQRGDGAFLSFLIGTAACADPAVVSVEIVASTASPLRSPRGAVGGTGVKTAMDGRLHERVASVQDEASTSSACGVMLLGQTRDVLAEIQVLVVARWGHGFLSASPTYVIILGGAAEAAALVGRDKESVAGPLYDALTLQFALPWMALAPGGAVAVHREAT